MAPQMIIGIAVFVLGGGGGLTMLLTERFGFRGGPPEKNRATAQPLVHGSADGGGEGGSR